MTKLKTLVRFYEPFRHPSMLIERNFVMPRREIFFWAFFVWIVIIIGLLASISADLREKLGLRGRI